MNNHLKHLEAHMAAITGISTVVYGNSITEEIVLETKKKLIETFINCSPEEREAYLTYLRAHLTYLRAYSVHKKMYGEGSIMASTNPLGHLQGVLSISGYPGIGYKINVTLKDLEDAHANSLIEGVLTDDSKK